MFHMNMGHKRRVTKEGRVNIPVEFLERFNIQVNEFVEVAANNEGIIIKKYVDKNVCAITQKVYEESELYPVGNVYVSKEGLELLKGLENPEKA